MNLNLKYYHYTSLYSFIVEEVFKILKDLEENIMKVV